MLGRLSVYALSKILFNRYGSFLKILLIFSWDINFNPGPVHGIQKENLFHKLPFHDCNFSGEDFYYNQNCLSENESRNEWNVFKKRGAHFIYININSLLPKIDEVCYTTNITNASINWIRETKLDKTIWSSELEVDGYDLVRLDWSRRGDGVACYIESSVTYSYKDSFCSNTRSIFVDIFLPNSKPILLGILYRPPDKLDFVKHFNNVFTETGVLDKQECYLLGDLNINLILDEKEI